MNNQATTVTMTLEMENTDGGPYQEGGAIA